MKKMRIVHAALRYPPATGGVETYVKQIVERTRNIEEGRDVRVITSTMRTHGPISELSGESLVHDPMYVQRLHALQTPFFSYPRLANLAYYLVHHKPSIVEAYSFWYQPADVAARYAKKNNIPFIFHPIFYLNENRQKLSWQLYMNTIGRRTFGAADVVVVISPYEQQLIEKQNFPVKRFELIPPGITTDQFKTEYSNPFMAKGLTGNIVLSVSRLSSGKKINEAVAAMTDILRHQPETHLVIIGEDFGAKKEIEALISSLSLEKRIHLWGKVSDAELAAAYQHASVLLHPSEYEAFGITLGESLAAGTPVVARNVGSVSYVVEPDQSGILFTNKDEMIAAVLRILDNKVLAQKMGLHGKTYIENNFAWEKSISKLLSLYAELQLS